MFNNLLSLLLFLVIKNNYMYVGRKKWIYFSLRKISVCSYFILNYIGNIIKEKK